MNAVIDIAVKITDSGKEYIQFDHLNSNYFIVMEHSGQLAVWTTLKGRRAGGIKLYTRKEFMAKYKKFDAAAIYNALAPRSEGMRVTDSTPSL